MRVRAVWRWLAVGGACLVATPAPGDSTRAVTLRWTQPEGAAASGYLVLVGERSGHYEQLVPVGNPSAIDGVRSFTLALPALGDLYVAVAAFNGAGLSPPSNERFLPALGLPASSQSRVVALGHGRPGPRTPVVDLAGELSAGPEVPGLATGHHVAWCDLDGDGLPELVLGQDASGSGQISVIDVARGRLRASLAIADSAATRPACGDLDGDGLDELVVGLDGNSGAYIQVFDDWSSFLLPLRSAVLDSLGRLPRVPWRGGRTQTGTVQPAVGDLDGDGRAEIVLALDSGSGGWVRVLDDAQAQLAALDLGPVAAGWLRATYADEAVWPALGDLDADGRAELVFGFATPGQLRVLDDPLERAQGSMDDGWSEIPLAAAAGSALHPAVGDLDADGRAELVLGFDAPLDNALLVLRDVLGARVPHPLAGTAGWLDLSAHALSGPVFPAVRSPRPEPDLPALLLGHARLGDELPFVRVDGRRGALPAGALATDLPAELAWCDVAGTGRPALVAGPGPGGEGILRVAAVGDAGVGAHFELTLGPADYRSANGELRPACGDLDGDGRDELVIGLGPGGAGELHVRDDGHAGLGPWPGLPGGVLAWSPWPAYLLRGGEARPAAGDLDGDGRDELAIGLGPGGAGWLQILDDATTGFAPLSTPPLLGGWLRWTGLAGYVDTVGASRPALGDIDGDGRDELAIGFDAGGGGRVVLLDDAAAGFAPLIGSDSDPSIRIPTSGDGATYPAFADVDGDGREELVVGFGAGDPRLYVLDDAQTGFAPHGRTPRGDGFVPLDDLGLQGPVRPAHGTP